MVFRMEDCLFELKVPFPILNACVLRMPICAIPLPPFPLFLTMYVTQRAHRDRACEKWVHGLFFTDRGTLRSYNRNRIFSQCNLLNL